MSCTSACMFIHFKWSDTNINGCSYAGYALYEVLHSQSDPIMSTKVGQFCGSVNHSIFYNPNHEQRTITSSQSQLLFALYTYAYHMYILLSVSPTLCKEFWSSLMRKNTKVMLRNECLVVKKKGRSIACTMLSVTDINIRMLTFKARPTLRGKISCECAGIIRIKSIEEKHAVINKGSHYEITL